MSDIPGTGYGSTHDWKRGHVCAAQIVDYRCRACGLIFSHSYRKQPDPFKAMRERGIGECRKAVQHA
jgi:hypothetical protein